MYRTIGFSFICLLLGVILGGALISLLPHPNHIHLTVMPYQGVNVSPEVGDIVDWAAFGQKTPPTITFSPYTGSPCRDQSPGSSCVYNEKADGIYSYSCSGSATCDPSMGPPGSGTRGGTGAILVPLLQNLGRLIQVIAITIDRTLGLLAQDQTTVVSSPPAAPNPGSPVSFSPQITSPTLALHTVATGEPDALVGCIGNKTSINNASISKTVGDSISWAGSSVFAVAVDSSVCQGDMSTPAYVQTCKLVKAAPTTAYTLTNVSCTAQPTLNAPTITSIAATPAIH